MIAGQDRLRILFVAARYFPYTGGTETHTHEVANRLATWGHDVTILTTDPSKELPVREDLEGVHIRRVPAWPTKSDYYLAPQIYSMIARNRGAWQIVHCQGYQTLVPPFAMLGAQRGQIPYILTFHSGGHSSRWRNAIRGLQRWALRPSLARAAYLVGVSRFEAELFRRTLLLPVSKFRVIRNGSQLPRLANSEAKPTSKTTILSVGRLESYKGHQRIIAAMPKILEQRPEVRLLVVGKGPYEEELHRLVQHLDLVGAVEITSVDAADREGMARVLASAALVTLLSDFEAHPISVMEALALGRPVLVTRTSGLAELADQGFVRDIPLRSSPGEIAAAVLVNLADPLLPEGIALPTWDECAQSLVSLYQEVLEVRG